MDRKPLTLRRRFRALTEPDNPPELAPPPQVREAPEPTMRPYTSDAVVALRILLGIMFASFLLFMLYRTLDYATS